MRQALLKLGFADVEETARGARIVKTEYERMIASGEHKLIISSCCHSVNLLIQKRYPQALPYLAKVDSPMLAHAKSIKERIPGSAVVFIGPCISKKDEAEQYGQVDCVLTFDELIDWLAEEGIELPAGEQPDGTEAREPVFCRPQREVLSGRWIWTTGSAISPSTVCAGAWTPWRRSSGAACRTALWR